MRDFEGIPTVELCNTKAAVNIFTSILGFFLDESDADGDPYLTVAVLRKGACEIRINKSEMSKPNTYIYLRCNSVASWCERLVSIELSPVISVEAGLSYSHNLECKVTDELHLVLLQRESNSDQEECSHQIDGKTE